MIEELKAYKQSVITEAVTKGIRNEELGVRNYKDSGIEWIGDVPEEWEVCRIRNLGITQNGISKGGEFFGEGEPFISYSDVYKNIELPQIASGLIQSSQEEQDRFSVCKGDVFFTRTSETIEEIGFSSTCTKTIEKAVYAGFLIRFRPKQGVLNDGYSKYYFRSDVHRAYFVKEMNIVTRASLSQDLLKSLVVLLPPISEQQAIADYLDKKCGEIDELITIKQQKIESLKEYKKSVIYEYVTGKREVE
jgi:type I restriction enzyme S subunit